MLYKFTALMMLGLRVGMQRRVSEDIQITKDTECLAVLSLACGPCPRPRLGASLQPAGSVL